MNKDDATRGANIGGDEELVLGKFQPHQVDAVNTTTIKARLETIFANERGSTQHETF